MSPAPRQLTPEQQRLFDQAVTETPQSAIGLVSKPGYPTLVLRAPAHTFRERLLLLLDCLLAPFRFLVTGKCSIR